MSSEVLIELVGTPEMHRKFNGNQVTTFTQAFTAATYAAVTVPSGAKWVLMKPDDTNTGTITVKGATGDTGVNVEKAAPSFHSLDTAGASFGLLCASSINVQFIFG